MAKLKQLTEQEMKDSKKRFTKLCEYSFVNQEKDLLLDEDDDDPNSEGGEAIPNQNAQVDLDKSNDNQQPQANQQKPSNGEDQPNIDANTPGPDVTDVQTAPAVPEPQPQPNIEPQSNDVEIDVTDLTQKQDDVDQKVNAMADQTQQMMDMLSQIADKVQGIVQNTDSEMNKLKDEIVKRNPTPVETLQKRITVSDPFTQTPEDYWKKKESEGHYRLSDDEDDNNEYTIKPSDIDTNVQDVYKSFGLDDDEMNQSLATMFRI